jgi:hypothetical protein
MQYNISMKRAQHRYYLCQIDSIFLRPVWKNKNYELGVMQARASRELHVMVFDISYHLLSVFLER